MVSKKYLDLLDQMKDLHQKKSAGYAGDDNPDTWANFRQSNSFGISPFLGCLIRLSDKWIRIQNLVRNPKNNQVNESIRDTLFDLSSYALIAICLYDEQVLAKSGQKANKKKSNSHK